MKTNAAFAENYMANVYKEKISPDKPKLLFCTVLQKIPVLNTIR